MSQIIRACNPR